jgi:uncharacterized protein with GYD domain
MAYYLSQMKYTAGAVGALINTPSDRESAARKLVEANGGKFHNMFYAYGAFDVIVLFEVSDENALAGFAALKASGAFVDMALTRLYTVSESVEAMQSAAKLQKMYLPPN